ncbi:MAG TPA: hypothetical protein VMI94_22840 [Bryobacteraceae bacterium]|nr:hypothetical protein [Bryobacteraceae bacterium]
MNTRKYLVTGLALIALVLGFTAVQAKAEPVLKGSFELPAAVYWGNTLLPPGEYTIWMSTEVRDLAHVPMIHITGEGVTLNLLAVGRPLPESGRNVLEISDLGGTHVVRAFDAGLLGQSFAFGVTRTVKSKALRASNDPATMVVVNAGF